nr:lysozyme [Acinetobacter dispersus]
MLLLDITCPPPVVGQPTTIYGVAIKFTLCLIFVRGIITASVQHILFIFLNKYLNPNIHIHGNRFERAVNGSVAMPLSQNQFDALVNLTYNIGETAFKKSTLLEMFNASNYRGAEDQFLVWDKSKGKVLNGLVRRRKTERELFLK